MSFRTYIHSLFVTPTSISAPHYPAPTICIDIQIPKLSQPLFSPYPQTYHIPVVILPLSCTFPV